MQELMDVEEERLSELLDLFECRTGVETGVGRLSGGFVDADVSVIEDDRVDIELAWGVQSDCQDNVNYEQYYIDRSLLSQQTWDVENALDELMETN